MSNIINPIAQSFYVEQDTGIFVTSVDLYFQSKDNYLPVTVQLRPMKYGKPSKNVYPFGEVVVDPSNVNTSFDSSLPTRITFPSPVYLTGKEFHSICILSNSDRYKVYVSTLGGQNIYDKNDPSQFPIVVNKQPLNGGLFKSQNSTTWNEEPYDDLKFTLYRANFNSNNGDITFFSPELNFGNGHLATLNTNPLEMDGRKIKISTSSIIQEPNLIIGNTIYQEGSGSFGNYVGAAGSATGSLSIINSGIGYTPSSGTQTYNNIPLINITSSGKSATANITVTDGEITSATISDGGYGYSIGDVLTAEIGTGIGRNLQVSLSNIVGVNQLILDEVQGKFEVGIGYTLQYINNIGGYVDINSGSNNVYVKNDGLDVLNDGLHIKVNHRNHGMHSNVDKVEISRVTSDTKPTKLTSEYLNTSTGEIFVTEGSTTDFSTFENYPVSPTNPGYIKIGQEIISYDGVTNNSLTGVITRGIDNTNVTSHFVGDSVMKYELNGISLRRINKVHDLLDATVENSIGLDYYTIKIDPSQNGNNRIDNQDYINLYIKETKSTGGSKVRATQNIQYSIVRPTIEVRSITGTSIKPTLRTISGKSIDGTEGSYLTNQFEPIDLNKNNYLNTQRAIYSKLNEQNNISNDIPGKKSLSLNMGLFSSSNYISPVIDLDRIGMILVSNRVNQRIDNYITDSRISSLINDPSAFVYATKTISLEVPATSLKLFLTAYVNIHNDLRAFYAIQNDPYQESIYYPFPGYSNINSLGQTIDESLNDGTSDSNVIKTDVLSEDPDAALFKEYEFTANNIESFRYFSIKLIGTSSNQTYPPLIKDLKAIALA
jgi:hypothetical protein